MGLRMSCFHFQNEVEYVSKIGCGIMEAIMYKDIAQVIQMALSTHWKKKLGFKNSATSMGLFLKFPKILLYFATTISHLSHSLRITMFYMVYLILV